METETIVDAKTGLNERIELNEKPTYLSLTNWRTVSEPNKKNPQEKPFIKFKADVWKYGESKDLLNVCMDSPKLFETTHVDLRRKLNAALEYRKASDQVLIRVKIVDAKAKPIIYDLEVC